MGALVPAALDHVVPAGGVGRTARRFLEEVDLSATLLDGMLSFLLFAGALHVDWTELRRTRWPTLVLSTGGVLLSTVLIGGGFLLLTRAVGLAAPPLWCLLFGALISPTDPVSVLQVLKRTRVPAARPCDGGGRKPVQRRGGRRVLDFGPLAAATLVWGGLRGGVSVALAPGLPEHPARPALIAATYAVVLFSVLIQGGTIAPLLARRERAVRSSASEPADGSNPAVPR